MILDRRLNLTCKGSLTHLQVYIVDNFATSLENGMLTFRYIFWHTKVDK